MKNHIILAMALSVGLVACGGGNTNRAHSFGSKEQRNKAAEWAMTRGPSDEEAPPRDYEDVAFIMENCKILRREVSFAMRDGRLTNGESRRLASKVDAIAEAREGWSERRSYYDAREATDLGYHRPSQPYQNCKVSTGYFTGIRTPRR
jgi:hypothetical protein